MNYYCVKAIIVIRISYDYEATDSISAGVNRCESSAIVRPTKLGLKDAVWEKKKTRTNLQECTYILVDSYAECGETNAFSFKFVQRVVKKLVWFKKW